MLPPPRAFVADTYSLEWAGHQRCLERWLWVTMDHAPYAPRVKVIEGPPVPQVRPPKPGAPDRALGVAYSVAGLPVPQDRRGQPSRRALHRVVLALEVAYLADLEQRGLVTPNPGEAESVREHLAHALARMREEGAGRWTPGEPFHLREVDKPPIYQRFGERAGQGEQRVKTLERWRRDGRYACWQLGAWPWALVDDGQLPSRWWRDERFDAALAAWAASPASSTR